MLKVAGMGELHLELLQVRIRGVLREMANGTRG